MAEPSEQCSPRSFRPTCASPQFQWGIAPISQEASDRHPVPLGLLATANGAAGRRLLMPCHSFGPGSTGPRPLCPSTSRSYDRGAILKHHGSQALLASRRPAGGRCAQGPGPGSIRGPQCEAPGPASKLSLVREVIGNGWQWGGNGWQWGGNGW